MDTATAERVAAPTPELVSKVTLPDESRLTREAQSFLTMVDSFVIDSTDTLQDAADERNRINDRFKALEEQRVFLKAPSLEQGRRIDAFFNAHITVLKTARERMDAKITGYQETERRKIEDAQRKAREEAEREAQRQREAAAKAEADARAKAEALRKQAEEAAAAGRAGEAAKLQERASSVQNAGELKAQDLAAAAEQTAAMPAPVSASVPKAAGIATQYRYSATVTDKLALLKHIVEKRPDLAAIVEIKESGLNQQATSLKEALDLPGVQLIKKPLVSDRR